VRPAAIRAGATAHQMAGTGPALAPLELRAADGIRPGRPRLAHGQGGHADGAQLRISGDAHGPAPGTGRRAAC
jgi:hypothetical protein